LIAERYRLDRLGNDAPDQNRRKQLNLFYKGVYMPLVKKIKLAEQAGDDDTAAELRQRLGDASDGL
jgi:hypothetical protein